MITDNVKESFAAVNLFTYLSGKIFQASGRRRRKPGGEIFVKSGPGPAE
jgi:hypothetical protein